MMPKGFIVGSILIAGILSGAVVAKTGQSKVALILVVCATIVALLIPDDPSQPPN